MAKFLFDWDSVGFALSFENFNIALHQPHPPGYILFVAIGKLVNLIFNDANITMIAINILFSILTVIVLYFLAKQMFSRKFAIVASILLVFNPIFWFYGEIAAINMSEAFFAALITYASYQFLRGDEKFLYISAIILGLSGGFRLDLLVFMFPLWLFCITYKNRSYERIMFAFIILVLSVLLWFIPTIMLAGGYENYLMASKSQFTNFAQIYSIFFGADISTYLQMVFDLLIWSIIGLGIIGAFLLMIFLFHRFKRIFKLSCVKNLNVIFLILWVLPAFLFYLLVFIAKPGYILVYLPVFTLILAYIILNISSHLNEKFNGISKTSYLILILTLCVTSSNLFMCPNGIDYGTIQAVDMNFRYMNQSLKEFNSNDTLIFVDNGNPWKQLRYYFPEFETYYFSRNSNGESYRGLWHYNNYRIEDFESRDLEININSSTTKIVWMINDNSEFFRNLKSKIEIKTLILPNGQTVYYSDVEEDTNFKIYDYIFKRGNV